MLLRDSLPWKSLGGCQNSGRGQVTSMSDMFGYAYDFNQDINVILDKGMMSLSPLNFHPITNEKTTSISPEDLLKYIGSCGHQPKIIDLE